MNSMIDYNELIVFIKKQTKMYNVSWHVTRYITVTLTGYT